MTNPSTHGQHGQHGQHGLSDDIEKIHFTVQTETPCGPCDRVVQEPYLEALLSDPNMLTPEREAITRLLVASMALDALAQQEDAE